MTYKTPLYHLKTTALLACTLACTSFDAMANTGTINVDGTNVVVHSSATLTTGSGDTLNKTGTGTLVFTNQKTDFEGTLSVNAGILQSEVADPLHADGDLTLNGGSLAVADSVTFTKNVALGGSGGTIIAAARPSTSNYTDAVTSSDWTLSGDITGANALAKTGAGKVTLSSTSNSGVGFDLSITEGTLSVSAVTNLPAVGGSVTLNGGTLEVDGDVTAAEGFALGAGSTISVTSGNTFTTNGAFTGNFLLTKTDVGALTLESDNSGLSGGFTLSAGQVNISAANQVPGGTLTLSGGALALADALDFDGNIVADGGGISVATSESAEASGVISGTGLFTKTGAGTLTLSGTQTSTGAFTLSAGQVNISATNNLPSGTLTLTAGTLNATSAVTLSLPATVDSVLTGAISSNNGDLTLNGAGTALDGGTLTLNDGETLTCGASMRLSAITVA